MLRRVVHRQTVLSRVQKLLERVLFSAHFLFHVSDSQYVLLGDVRLAALPAPVGSHHHRALVRMWCLMRFAFRAGDDQCQEDKMCQNSFIHSYMLNRGLLDFSLQRKQREFISGRFPMTNSVSIVRIAHLCRLGYFSAMASTGFPPSGRRTSGVFLEDADEMTRRQKAGSF